ncbi:GDSL esterase/lipase at1g29670 [Phtheirospermum japonicum]|uniref:GDSL esterase/lipase at1g29670 n=1 Tax=Phtheirospermum japonicum TaxID=374723 RepID=A0A830CBF5_9LAMI|nr:GDSL esterase/lipase at1g29670 [Phtheirospermum japonicum]
MQVPNFAKSVILSTLCVTIIMVIEGKPQVPCLFFMGDSLTDNGNNNLLITLAKANYLPYGIDYPDGPSGRFSNGRLLSDFLAEYLGFDKPIPPFATAYGSEILKGVNYGSASAGILDDTSSIAGDRISLNRQLFNHGITVFKIALLLGNTSLTGDHLKKCLYIVNMGSNDYLNNYLRPQFYKTSTLYTPNEFATILSKQYSQQLRTLYSYGARKIVVHEVGLLGCLLGMLTKSPDSYGSSNCNEPINDVVQSFNYRLKQLIDTLNRDLPDAQFILINTTSISRLDPSSLGIKVSNAPCCVVSEFSGLCKAGKDPCSNRDEYTFWDNYHPSEIFNRAMAARAYNAALSTDAYPFDIRRLAQL